MPIEITMPRLSDTMEEGTLVKWRVAVGDEVSSGDHLADVETDKATMELQAFDDGKVAKIAVEEGQTAPVGSLILVLAEDGEDLEEAAKAAGSGEGQASKKEDSEEKAEAEGETEAESKDEQQTESQTTDDTPAQAVEAQGTQQTESTTKTPAGGGEGDVAAQDSGSGGRIKISPLARRMAEDAGLDLNQISGSGPEGRIVKRDVKKAIDEGGKKSAAPAAEGVAAAEPVAAEQPPAAAPPAPAKLESKSIPLSNMRKTIAKRLVESKTQIPHFQVNLEINADPLMELRKTINAQLEAQGVKLSVNDFIVRAIALAAVQHPEANSSWQGDTIEQHGTVNVGVAISLPAEKGGGLVVATIRDTQNKGLRQISQEIKALAQKARKTGLTVEEMSDATITLSNLGMYGVTSFNAIINPPNAAIVAVGAAQERAVVREGELTIGHEMTATLSGDHRVIDGAAGAEYLQTLKGLIENPAALLV